MFDRLLDRHGRTLRTGADAIVLDGGHALLKFLRHLGDFDIASVEGARCTAAECTVEDPALFAAIAPTLAAPGTSALLFGQALLALPGASGLARRHIFGTRGLAGIEPGAPITLAPHARLERGFELAAQA